MALKTATASWVLVLFGGDCGAMVFCRIERMMRGQGAFTTYR
jgi:hypothetical protein